MSVLVSTPPLPPPPNNYWNTWGIFTNFVTNITRKYNLYFLFIFRNIGKNADIWNTQVFVETKQK
jgi:hypothetical protein